MQYDSEEHEIIEALEHDAMALTEPTAQEIEAIKEAARSTFKKG
jgi:hypothetical protein